MMSNTSRRKVLYLGGFEMPDKNAAAQRVLANAKALREMNCEVFFVGISHSVRGNEVDRGEVEGFSYYQKAYPVSLTDWMRHLCSFIDDKIIVDYDPDIVIAYNYPAVALFNLRKLCNRLGAKLWGDVTEWYMPTGMSPRSIAQRLDVWLRMYYCNKKMDGIIAISKYLNDYYCKSVPCIQVPPLVDLEQRKWNRERSISVNKPIKMVFAGSASKTKERLDIIINVVSKFPEIMLTVIGLTEEQFRNKYGCKFVPQNVLFLGRISHTEAIRNIQNSDFQIFLRDDNIANTAGFPTKFVESISCGVPVITNSSSNIKDYLGEGKLGILIDDMSKVEEALIKISDMSDAEILTMKKNCKETLIFDYRSWLDSFSSILV